MLDYEDSETLTNILRAVRSGDDVTARLLRRVVEEQEKSNETQLKLLDAFNRMAENMAALAQAVEGLRDDMNPQMDKPAKLARPAGQKQHAPKGGRP